MSGWKKLSSKYVYKNPWIKVREDKVIQPDGKEGIYGVIEQHAGALIIPVDSDGKIWMVKNYRYIFDDADWELVAGDVEPGEKLEAAGQRELIEELGLQAEKIRHIASFRPSPGRMDQTSHILVAEGLQKVRGVKDDWDVLEKNKFTLPEIDEMIKAGKVLDGYVMNALYFYKLHKDL